MDDLTLIYYTDNRMPESFTKKARGLLLKTGLPIISVSQKPIDFGRNYCIGEIGVSCQNVYKQALYGISRAKTKYVAMCEADVLYPSGYFDFRPTADVGYNQNVYVLHARRGFFSSRFHTHAFSQCIGDRKVLERTIKERQKVPETYKHHAEPGKAEQELGLTPLTIEFFKSEHPVIDIIEHSSNLSRRTRTKGKKTSKIPYWGKYQNVVRRYHVPVISETLEKIRKRFGFKSDGVHKLNISRHEMYGMFNDFGYKTGVEMGVCRARNAVNILNQMPEANMYFIDCWDAVGSRTKEIQKKWYASSMEKLNAYGDRVKVIRKWSMDAAKDFKDESLDFVYIDGDHRFDAVIQDIITWSKKVRIGGIVSGHDYYKSQKEGVVLAVNSYVTAHNIKNLFLTNHREDPPNPERNDRPRSWFWVKEC